MQCFICLVLILVLHNKVGMLFLVGIESSSSRATSRATTSSRVLVELLVLFLSVVLCFYSRRAESIVSKMALRQQFAPPFCNGGYFLLQYLLLLHIFHCYFGAIGIFQSYWMWMAVSDVICNLRSYWCVWHLTLPKLFLLHKNTRYCHFKGSCCLPWFSFF